MTNIPNKKCKEIQNIQCKKCKTLTEQYYNGTLLSDYYYFNNGHITYPVEHHLTTPPLCVDGIKVMCKIPEYEEYIELLKKIDELEKKLDIAVKALNTIDKIVNRIDLSGLRYEDRRRIYGIIFDGGIIDDALKQIKEVK